tara:strand:- start:7 stop:240 length:234 start_codon:yes stop_codon:yes gene_type:complete
MKDNKIYGSIVGGVLGFIFVVTCTSPLSSDASDATGSGKYRISTCRSNSQYIYETIINTETGLVTSRTRVSVADYGY